MDPGCHYVEIHYIRMKLLNAGQIMPVGTAKEHRSMRMKYYLSHRLCRCCYQRRALFRYRGAVCAYLEKTLPLVESALEKADYLLMIGQARESSGDLKAARMAYQRAFRLPQEKNDVWYFLNNNVAYCLNDEGKHERAELHCRAAIKINGRRHNAHKNLGIALEGQGGYVDAARSYMRAAKLCPQDTSAAGSLERLIGAHGASFNRAPKFRAQLDAWRRATKANAGRSQAH
jgi:tetratricopeptide (TPR) repeat protein